MTLITNSKNKMSSLHAFNGYYKYPQKGNSVFKHRTAC